MNNLKNLGNEELLSNYQVAIDNLTRAISGFKEEYLIFELMQVAENYKQEILRRMNNEH